MKNFFFNQNKVIGNYGYLYNWYAYSAVNLAPVGWHVATGQEFNTLMHFVSPTGSFYNNDAGYKLMEIGTSHWTAPANGAQDVFGFSAVASGTRNETGVFINLIRYSLNLWGTVPAWDNPTMKSVANMVAGSSKFTVYESGKGTSQMNIKCGLPVRLVKDDTVNPGTLVDYDGNVYNCITIGTQVWIKQNLKVAHYNDGSIIPTVTDDSAWAALVTGAKCAPMNYEGFV